MAHFTGARNGLIGSNPIWVDQHCANAPGPLPPLSPQYQTYSNQQVPEYSHPQSDSYGCLQPPQSANNNNSNSLNFDHFNRPNLLTPNNHNANASMMTAITSSPTSPCTVPNHLYNTDNYAQPHTLSNNSMRNMIYNPNKANNSNTMHHSQFHPRVPSQSTIPNPFPAVNTNPFPLISPPSTQQQRQQQQANTASFIDSLPRINTDSDLLLPNKINEMKNERKKSKSKCITKQLPKRFKNKSPTVTVDEYKKQVKGWWIGQRIVVETVDGIKMTARIKDWCSESKRSQVWYDNDESTFEWLRLDHLKHWTVPDALKICDYAKQYKVGKDCKYKILDFIPQTNGFVPMEIDLLQRVSVLYRDGNWYTAFIDGYCRQSRRHHVHYGDTSEWMWISKQRCKAITGPIMENAEMLRSEIEANGKYAVPPPFDPQPYGLDKSFVKQSKSKTKTKSKKKKKRTKIIKIKKKKRKKLCDDEMEMEKDVLPKRKKQKKMKKKSSSKNNNNNIINNTATMLIINNNHSMPQEQKNVIPTKPPPPTRRVGNPMYPRFVILNGMEWKRAYSNEEKKYFWSSTTQSSNGGEQMNAVQSSWNPWNENGAIAPWMEKKGNWSKFMDESGTAYWFNYGDQQSTYDRPRDYVSDVEIDHDSMDDD